MKDTLVIVNPASGGGKTGRGWPETAARLRSAGLDFDYALTEGPARATELARAAVGEGRSLVVAAGGDGTISEVSCGFFAGGEPIQTRSRLGVLPMGTGGDFRRTFAMSRDLETVAATLLAGRTRRIDAGRVRYRRADGGEAVGHFVNVADAGIGGQVVRMVNSRRKVLSGEITFTLASGLALLRWRNQPMKVVADGQVRELTAQQVVVANCQYFGGGMRIAPYALPDDGLFDVIIGGDLSRLESVRLMGPLRSGEHLERRVDKIDHLTASRVEVSSPSTILLDLDGEQPGMLPAVFEVLPGAIELVVP
jgi:diacylglycerol kinase (ATP)